MPSLRTGAIDQALGGVRRIDERCHTCLAVTKQVAEIMITANANLLENEVQKAIPQRDYSSTRWI